MGRRRTWPHFGGTAVDGVGARAVLPSHRYTSEEILRTYTGRHEQARAVRSEGSRCEQVWAGAGRCEQVWAGAGRCEQVWAGADRCAQARPAGPIGTSEGTEGCKCSGIGGGRGGRTTASSESEIESRQPIAQSSKWSAALASSAE